MIEKHPNLVSARKRTGFLIQWKIVMVQIQPDCSSSVYTL